MNPAAIIDELHALGIRLERVGGRLRLDAPKGALHDHHRAFLKKHRSAVVDYLERMGSPGGDAEASVQTEAPPEVQHLGIAAVEHFLDRLGRADDLGMHTVPGSAAWTIALREARRVGAGLRAHHDRDRGPDAVDIALELFTPPDGRIAVRSLTAEELAELGIKKTT